MRTLPNKLVSPTQRADIVRTYGAVIGPILEAKLEAKAAELVERYRLAWISAFDHLANASEREKLLVSRDEGSDLLACSLARAKGMAADGLWPTPGLASVLCAIDLPISRAWPRELVPARAERSRF
jgi:hypothetical protein